MSAVVATTAPLPSIIAIFPGARSWAESTMGMRRFPVLRGVGGGPGERVVREFDCRNDVSGSATGFRPSLRGLVP